jgi:hypothetical protein
MTELATIQPAEHAPLGVVMDYARAVSTAAMLPDNYRGKPADIMLAVGLGQSMGLSPAESLYRISVIKGKPTASAELIAANVRKAGHRLRVRGDDSTCTATILRADDPEFPFEVTRDMGWAKSMGLADQPNYRKQPGTMLQWRAITAVARLACPEALYGVAYTPDEMGESEPWDGTTRPPSGPSSADRARQAIRDEPTPEQVTAERVEDEESPLLNTSSGLAKAMYAGINEAGIPESDRIPYIGAAIGRGITSTKEMTEAEARVVLDSLNDTDGGEAR